MCPWGPGMDSLLPLSGLNLRSSKKSDDDGDDDDDHTHSTFNFPWKWLRSDSVLVNASSRQRQRQRKRAQMFLGLFLVLFLFVFARLRPPYPFGITCKVISFAPCKHVRVLVLRPTQKNTPTPDPVAIGAHADGTLGWTDVARAGRSYVAVPRGATTLAHLRDAATQELDDAFGGAAWRFLRFERGGAPLAAPSEHVDGCFYPIGRAEEGATHFDDKGHDSGAYEGLYVTIADRAVHAAQYSKQIHGAYWGGQPRSEAHELHRQLPSPLCRRWAREQHLLRRIAEERSFWCDQGASNPEVRFIWEDRMAEAMRSLGWNELSSPEGKSKATMVIRGGWNWNEIFSKTHPGEQVIARHPGNAWFTQKDNLLLTLRRVNRLGSCHVREAYKSANGALPPTYFVNDAADCKLLVNGEVQPANGWARKVGDVHIGKGVTMESGVTQEDRKRCEEAIASGEQQDGGVADEQLSTGVGDATIHFEEHRGRIMYQARIAPLFLDNRPTSLRVYLVIASYDPLVVLWNHHSGHMYITGKASENAWYTQHESFESRTFQQVSDFIAEEAKRTNANDSRLASFFARAMLPRMRESLALTAHAIAMRIDEQHGADRSRPRSIVRGGDGIGPIGRFDHWCVDFMVGSTDFVSNKSNVADMAAMVPFLLEMSDACMFKGSGPKPPDYNLQGSGEMLDAVHQRAFFVKDVMELTLAVQVHALEHRPIRDLIDADSLGGSAPPTLFNGQFELLLSRQPGSEYDYLDQLHGASCASTSSNGGA